MGVCNSVELVNPTVFRQVNDAFKGQPEITASFLCSLFSDLGRKPSEAIAAEISGDEPFSDTTIKVAYDELVTDETIWLDKSLSRGLDIVLKSVPALTFLREMFLEFGHFDFEPPQNVPQLDFGIFGFWENGPLLKAQKAFHLFQQPDDTVAHFGEVKFSLVERLTNRPSRLSAALQGLRNHYEWQYWSTASRAVDAAIEGGYMLGYSIR